MTLQKALERALKVRLAGAGMTLSEWARQHGVERKTAAYRFTSGAMNLATLSPIADSFGVPVSVILAEAEKLMAEAPKP